jgi:hypothetical protein
MLLPFRKRMEPLTGRADDRHRVPVQQDHVFLIAVADAWERNRWMARHAGVRL